MTAWRRITVDGIRLEGDDARRLLREVRRDIRAEGGRSVRSRLLGASILAVGLAVLGAFVIIVTPLLLPSAWRTVVLAVASVLFGAILGRFVVIAHYRRHRAAFRRAMHRRGFELCTHCGYWLKGLDDETLCCPECGEPRALRS